MYFSSGLRAFLVSALLLLAVLPASAASEPAKNVILMIADGIGFNGWMAADYYAGKAGERPYQVPRPDGTAPLLVGQTTWSLNPVDGAGELLGKHERAVAAVPQGYDAATRWHRFEATFENDFAPVGRSYTTYTDSAAAGTALHSGKKTLNGRINVDWRGESAFMPIGQLAHESGRSVGIVTSVMASHATPASAWSNNLSRDNYAEIFNEMVDGRLDVLMGAGHPEFDNDGRRVQADEDDLFRFVGGRETWEALKAGGHNGYAFIDGLESFEAVATGDMMPERLVGIFQAHRTAQARRQNQSADPHNPSGMAFVPNVPELATMATGALQVLSRNEDGLFLMVEGGAVDWMGHDNDMPRFIEEQEAFNQAVVAVIDWVETHSSWEETLLIVTADHETGGIWGEGTFMNGEGGAIATSLEDEAAVEAARFDPTEDRFERFLAVQDRGAGNLPGYQFASGKHTNELVPLWALGHGADAFQALTRHDAFAGRLWGRGAPYDWDGDYVENTHVFDVMQAALRLPAVLPSPLSSAKSHKNEKNVVLRFAIIGDAEPKPLAEFPGVAKTVDHINRLAESGRIDLVAGVGDIPHKGTTIQYDAVTAVLSQLVRPFYPIMGNEEFGSTERRFLRYANQWSMDQSTIDSVRYVVEHDEIALIFATPDRDGRDFSDEGLAWVEEQLEALAPKPVFLFTHGAPVGVFPAGGDKGINHPRIESVLAHENLAAVFSGDLHMDIERIDPFREINGVTHVHVPALERTKVPDKTRHTPYFHVVSVMTDAEVLIETYRAGDDADAAPRFSHRFALTD
ncbi:MULTISPECIES: alkaline phosphatase [unclassified Ectothiorhodospira]|uniref:alkaline phosphatase n=1 Tax=unclassified Ectothiorhodospira TaxID=2684909 RepID=UPI001EE8E66E|nr:MULTISPECIES: alkaline phosphatase [unclassified Ectothiorhodospira]MCG5515579.1 alkaline phosphatase [Ectothiorhodospira sp. 9100]MCG5518738.1 alkaline phosphatase [Ectothiorhodospira sp. 9905]